VIGDIQQKIINDTYIDFTIIFIYSLYLLPCFTK